MIANKFGELFSSINLVLRNIKRNKNKQIPYKTLFFLLKLEMSAKIQLKKKYYYFLLTEFTLALIATALLSATLPHPVHTFTYPVFGTKRYHRSTGRSSLIEQQPPPPPPPAPPATLYDGDGLAQDYYETSPYEMSYQEPQPALYNYPEQPALDEELINYMPDRESEYYGLPTYKGDYHPTPYYYSQGPSYRYYDDRNKQASNPLDDIHERIQLEDARERQKLLENSYYGEGYAPAGSRTDSKLTSTFLRNLIAYNNQMNQNAYMSQPADYSGANEYNGTPNLDMRYEAPNVQEIPHQKQNRHKQPKKGKKQRNGKKQKQQQSVVNEYDNGNNVAPIALANQEENALYPHQPPFDEPKIVDQDVEALNSLVSNKKQPQPKSPKNNRKSGNKKQKQRQRQQAKKEKERRDRELALEEQRQQQILADQEQIARREMLAQQQAEERRQQQELQQQQMRREQLLMQQQLQGEIASPQYADYQQEPSTLTDYFVEPEYDDSWSTWERKRSQVPQMPMMTIEELVALSNMQPQEPRTTTSTTTTTTTTTAAPAMEPAIHSRSARIPGDGQKEIMQPRPANPLRHPFASPLMEMLTHNALDKEREEEKRDVSSNGEIKSNTAADATVYDTIKKLLAIEQSLDEVSLSDCLSDC